MRLAIVQGLHAHGAQRIGRTLEHHFGNQGVLVQKHVVALQRRAQIGHGGAPASAFVGGHVHGAQAFLLVAVHVFGDGVARLLTRFDKCAVQRVAHGGRTDFERPAVAAIGIAADSARFGLFEVGQAMRIRPILHTALQSPTLVIQRMAAHINHAVDGRGATQGLTTRAVDAPPFHKGLGF